MRLPRRLVAAALTAALLPASAWAQGSEAPAEEPFSFEDFLNEPRTYTIDEIAADLAYGFCPLLLAGQFPLDSPQLAERGFGTAIATAPDERFGEVSMVTARRDDGRVAFGGVSGKACVVVIDGPQRDAALTALRERKEWTGLDFQPADNPDAVLPGTTVETFKAAAESQFLYLQLIQSGSTNPLVSALLYVRAE